MPKTILNLLKDESGANTTEGVMIDPAVPKATLKDIDDILCKYFLPGLKARVLKENYLAGRVTWEELEAHYVEHGVKPPVELRNAFLKGRQTGLHTLTMLRLAEDELADSEEA